MSCWKESTVNNKPAEQIRVIKIVPELSNENNTVSCLEDTAVLKDRIHHRLNHYNLENSRFKKDIIHSALTSSVLFLIGPQCKNQTDSREPCLILNKRSLKVKQPGDLCCPGGSIASRIDPYLAKLLYLPGSPLFRWSYWSQWRARKKSEAETLALLFATGLRESFEEMRLNPLGVIFLGPLPPQQLVTFNRVIYPMVCWLSRPKRFKPNWEVEKIVYISLKKLLDPVNYARYRIQLKTSPENQSAHIGDMPCFIHEHAVVSERLWGATFRITMVFLDLVFGFKPPALETIPVVHGALNENYRTGSR